MPEQKTMERARRARREGKAPSTQAGAFVEEEIGHIRSGRHGARSTKQAIAIGLSKARRAGVDLPRRPKGRVVEKMRRGAERAPGQAQAATKRRRSAKRARATLKALKREGRQAASRKALARHAHRAAARRRAA